MSFTTTQKIIKIGSSKGTILPAKALKNINADVGDSVKISVEVTKKASQADLLDEYKAFTEQYGTTLKNLSQR